MDIRNIKKENILRFGKNFPMIFGKNIRIFVFILFLIFSGYCLFVWYTYAYNPQWSEERRNGYIQSKSKEVSFNQAKFEKILEEKKNREEHYKKEFPALQDIFRLRN